MPFNRPVCRIITSTRTSSTIVGQSGRNYIQGNVLQRHCKNPELSVYQAQYILSFMSTSPSLAISLNHLTQLRKSTFVFKRVPESFFTPSLHLKSEFAGTSRLQMHIDYNQEERILVYEYFRHTLLALIKEYSGFPAAEIKKILRRTGEAVKEFHDKGWIHLDLKPDKILVNWICDEQCNPIVTDVVLGDFDIAFKPKGGEPLQTGYAIGNIMWRSPEGQTAKGVTKASNMFSFGLVVSEPCSSPRTHAKPCLHCIYALGAGNALLLNDYQDLANDSATAEQEILLRRILYFGPLPEGLLKQVNDKSWCDALEKVSEMAEDTVNCDPRVKFEQWGEDLAPNLSPEAKSMISGMINLNPAARTTIDEVLKHR